MEIEVTEEFLRCVKPIAKRYQSFKKITKLYSTSWRRILMSVLIYVKVAEKCVWQLHQKERENQEEQRLSHLIM